MRTNRPALLLVAAVLAAVLAPRRAAADDLPPPHEIFPRILRPKIVQRVTGVAEVLPLGRPKAKADKNRGYLQTGLLLFPSPRTGTRSDAAMQVRVMLGLTVTPDEARDLYGSIRLPSAPRIALLSGPTSRGWGDRTETCQGVKWRGTDGETYIAEGRLLKGRYALFMSVEGRHKRYAAARLERILMSLMELLAVRLPVEAAGRKPSRPDDSTIVRSNAAPRIASIEVVAPGNAGVLEDDRAIKVVARYQDPDGEELLARWQVHDAHGVKLFDGAGKRTRGGNTAICRIRAAEGSPPPGPLIVTLRVQDERRSSDTKRISVPIHRPVARLLGGLGDLEITRKHRRLQNVATKSLYEGDTITLYRDITWLGLSEAERAELGRMEEPLSFVDIEWPKYQARGRFLIPRSAPTLCTRIIVGRRPQHVTGVGDAVRFATDQLFTLVYEDYRDKGAQAVIRRVSEHSSQWLGRTVAPLFAVAMSPDATAEDTAYVALKSEVVIRGDGRGGVGMYTLQGAPTVIEPNGRRRFTFPMGTWASIDARGVHAEGSFPPGSVRSRWSEVDAHPYIKDLRRLLHVASHQEGGLPWALLAGLAWIGGLGFAVMRNRATASRGRRSGRQRGRPEAPRAVRRGARSRTGSASRGRAPTPRRKRGGAPGRARRRTRD